MVINRKRKFLASFTAFIFLFVFSFSPTPAFSQAAGPQIGVVAGISGVVQLQSPSGQIRTVKSGDPVHMGEHVLTDDEGQLQILLLDQTVFTVSSNSDIVIDEFVYDPKSADGKIHASLTKGFFRYISGKIGDKEPKNVEIDLPTATLGIRGTVIQAGFKDGKSVAVLLGPGEDNNGRKKKGSFVMIPKTGSGFDSQKKIKKTGFGVSVGNDGQFSKTFKVTDNQAPPILGKKTTAPTKVFRPSSAQTPGNQVPGKQVPQGFTPNQVKQPAPVIDPFQTQRTFQADDGGKATEKSGQLRIGATNDVTIVKTLFTKLGFIVDDPLKKPEDIDGGTRVADGLTQLQDLSRIQTGVFHFYVNNAPITQYLQNGSAVKIGGGSFNAKWQIDFGSKTVGGGGSFVDIDVPSGGSGLIDHNVNIPKQSFGSGPGAASFSHFETFFGGAYGIGSTLELRNAGGVVADNAKISAQLVGYDMGEIKNGATGSGNSPRFSGPA